MTELPTAPTSGVAGLQVVPPAGPYWRIWHPSDHTTAGNQPRFYGPLSRFDPHPDGPPAIHESAFVLYGSLAFDVSALEVFHRGDPGALSIVDVCRSWRGTLVDAPAESRVFDLTDANVAASVGAATDLGNSNLDDVGYGVTQGWGRFLHDSAGVQGVRYLSCRASDRGGIAVALWQQDAIGSAAAEHLLVDDALWPYLVYALEAVGVGVRRVDECPRC